MQPGDRTKGALSPKTAKLMVFKLVNAAAGTGVVTRALAPQLAAEASYIVTDLNQPMLDYAA